jgi:hypothetical protein
MTLEERNNQLAEQFAGKFFADHSTDDSGIYTKGINDTSDEHLHETFKNCVAPLNTILYPLCREHIKNLRDILVK